MKVPNKQSSTNQQQMDPVDRFNQRAKERGRYPDKPQGLDVSLGNSSAIMFHGILGTFNPGEESPFPPSHDQEHIEE